MDPSSTALACLYFVLVTCKWEDLQVYALAMADVTRDEQLMELMQECSSQNQQIGSPEDPEMPSRIINAASTCACRRLRAIIREGGGKLSESYPNDGEMEREERQRRQMLLERDDGRGSEEEGGDIHLSILSGAYFQGIVQFIAQSISGHSSSS